MLALPAALGAFLTAWLGAPADVAAAVGVLLGVLASALVIAGKPNRHTMNDNTSGVVALSDAAFPPAEGTARPRGRGAV